MAYSLNSDREIRLHVACSPGEWRVAAVAGNRLVDYALWRPGRPDGVGDLSRGRITRVVPALAGSFVALPGMADGFLPDSDVEGRPLEGRVLGVRVTRAAQGGKGPRLTAVLPADEAEMTSVGPERLVRRGADAVTRLASVFVQALVLVDDAGVAAGLRSALGERLHLVARAFDETLEDLVGTLGDETVLLAGGGRLRVQPTAALTAIDIDLGQADDRGGKTRTHARFNQDLIPELARQIRLRNLGGAILVDFAGLSIRRRQALGPALQAALEQDTVQTRLVGFTGLGLAEILRRRVRPPLHELLGSPHGRMAAALRAVLAEAPPTGARPVLHVAPDLLAAYAGDGLMQQGLAARGQHHLILMADPQTAPGGWRLGMERTSST